MSFPASLSFNPLRVKVEPKIQHLTIEGPGQTGITADYVVGAVESLAAYLRTLPPNQDKIEIKNLRNRIENAEKQVNVAAEKAKHMEEKIARLEREKFELEGRVQRRNQAIEIERQARKNDYYVFKKKWEDSENEKNGLLKILAGMRKIMSEPGAIKLAAKASVTSSENQKPGPVHPGSKSFAKPAANLDASLAIVSNTPLPSPIPLDSSQLPANSDILPTVRFLPFTAPNLEFAGWRSDDVQMGMRKVQESNSDEELKNKNQGIRKLKSFSRLETPKNLKDQDHVPSIPLPTKTSSPSSKKAMRSRPY